MDEIEIVAAPGLSVAMQRLVDRTLAADRKGGESLWEKALAVADARVEAQTGEWGAYLDATGQHERAAQRLIAIATRGRADERFRGAIITGWLPFSVGAIAAQADDELLSHLLDLPTPPTHRQVKALTARPDNVVGSESATGRAARPDTAAYAVAYDRAHRLGAALGRTEPDGPPWLLVVERGQPRESFAAWPDLIARIDVLEARADGFAPPAPPPPTGDAPLTHAELVDLSRLGGWEVQAERISPHGLPLITMAVMRGEHWGETHEERTPGGWRIERDALRAKAAATAPAAAPAAPAPPAAAADPLTAVADALRRGDITTAYAAARAAGQASGHAFAAIDARVDGRPIVDARVDGRPIEKALTLLVAPACRTCGDAPALPTGECDACTAYRAECELLNALEARGLHSRVLDAEIPPGWDAWRARAVTQHCYLRLVAPGIIVFQAPDDANEIRTTDWPNVQARIAAHEHPRPIIAAAQEAATPITRISAATIAADSDLYARIAERMSVEDEGEDAEADDTTGTIEIEDNDEVTVSRRGEGMPRMVAEVVAQIAEALRLLARGEAHAVDTSLLGELARALTAAPTPARGTLQAVLTRIVEDAEALAATGHEEAR